MSLTEGLKQRAKELGFCAVGVTGAERFQEAETAAADRTKEGLMDGLPWWSEGRAHASADPRRNTPDAQSVIALAFPYPNTDSGVESNEGPRGRIASYALGRDYHEVLLERMQPLLAMLREQGHRAKSYVDHGWMLDRAAAARAGIGWLGKNTNLLVPGPLKKNCGSCDACIRVCPTGALVSPGVLDNRRCISFWTINRASR